MNSGYCSVKSTLILLLLIFTELAYSSRSVPNIVLILVDDLGYGEIGPYGQKTIMTPRLDQMAREGVVFSRFYAGSSVCAPSRSVLLTGLHTGHTRVRGNSSSNNYAAQTLDSDDLTIADVLKRGGYATAIIGKWGVGDVGSGGTPDRVGFDYYFGFLNQTHAHNHFPSFLWRNGKKVELENDLVPLRSVSGVGYSKNRLIYANDLFFEDAESYIRKHAGKPFFLFLTPTLPHANNERSRELGDGMEVPDYGSYASENWPDNEKGHAAMNERIDLGVGMLLDLLDELNLADDTVVMFTSDNGPHQEGGVGYDPEYFDSNGPLRGIKRDFTDGGIRVPLIVRCPKRIAADRVSNHVGFFGDFMPTLAEFAEIEVDSPHDGLSLVPTLVGGINQAEHDFLYWEFYEGGITQAVLLDQRWKGIRSNVPSGQILLYDQVDDPQEGSDCAAKYPQIIERIESVFEAEHIPNRYWQIH